MICWRYRGLLADWASGRLAADRADAVQSHVNSCAKCRELAEAESRMVSAFRKTNEPSQTPDLWMRVQGRLAEPAPARRNVMVTRLAFAGAAASLAIVALFAIPRGDNSVANDPGAGRVAVIPTREPEKQAMTDLTSMRAQAQDEFLIETADYRPNARIVLIGGAGQ